MSAQAVLTPTPALDTAKAVSEQRRRKRISFLMVNGARLAVGVALIGSWQVFAGKPGSRALVLIDEYYVSRPTDIWDSLVNFVETGVLWPNVWVTVQEMILGFAVGLLLGLLAGFVVGSNRFVSDVAMPYVSALYSVPRLALVPLFLLWFGLGLTSKVAFVGMLVFFLVFYNTYAGVRDVDKDLVNTLRLMGAGRWTIVRRVTIPSAMTWILAGLRVSAPYALVGAVTSEMISSNEGLGYMLTRASGQFDTSGVFAAIAVMMALAIVVNGLVAAAERYFLAWKSRGEA
ncbi:ABC transporter permease [Nocardioides sp. LHD-245]|uniref:ABC transporter permease n=1 Tax=Nocardioides sp. LHD-245 TaxID=3051387 RepID=UPI0027E1140E|nr:ABC transporter permease [Nocardioides sp. LHD-245]